MSRDLVPSAGSRPLDRGVAVLAIVLQRAITTDMPRLGAAALGPLPPAAREQVAPALAAAFGSAFWVAFALTAAAVVPALLLPRARQAGHPSPPVSEPPESHRHR